MHPFTYTAPVSMADYLGERFLAAFVLNAGNCSAAILLEPAVLYIPSTSMYNTAMYTRMSSLATGDIMEINKDLMAASSTPIVLAILAEEDSYGYKIIKRVRELSGGRIEWTDGMLYPVLHRLERLGHIEARWQVADSGRRRKYYSITSQGRAQLAEERRQWQAVDATLRGIWQALTLPVPASHPASATPLPQGG